MFNVNLPAVSHQDDVRRRRKNDLMKISSEGIWWIIDSIDEWWQRTMSRSSNPEHFNRWLRLHRSALKSIGKPALIDELLNACKRCRCLSNLNHLILKVIKDFPEQ